MVVFRHLFGRLLINMMDRFKRFSRWGIFFTILISVFWLWQTRALYFDYDLERFLPIGDPDTEFFYQFQDRFGVDNDYILIGFRPAQGVFDSSFLHQLNQLTTRLEKLPQTERVINPTQFRFQRRNPNPFGPRVLSTPFFHLNNPERYRSDSLFFFQQKGWIKSFFSEDRKAVLLQLWHKAADSDEFCADLSTEVQQLVDEMEVDHAEIAGKCFGQTTFIRTLQFETVLFTGTSILAVFILLFWAYRTLLGVALPLIVVGLSVLWTIGLMAVSGKPFDLISNIIPTVLLVIGVADAIHLVTHFQLYRKAGLGLSQALKKAVKEVGTATLLTTMTTAVGFLTLTTSTFIPLIEVGWVTTVGLFFALLLTYTLIPAILVLYGEVFKGFSDRSAWWNRLLLQWLSWVMNNRQLVIVISVLVLLVSPIGITQLKVNNYLLEDLKPDHPRRQAFHFFESHFSGARGMEIALVAKQENADLLQLKVLRQIERLDSFLLATYGVGSLISPVEILKQANQVSKGGDPDFYSLPSSQEDVTNLIDRFKQETGQDIWGKYVSSEKKPWMRISGLTKDEGSAVFSMRNQALMEWVKKELTNTPFQVHVSGTPHLLDLNNSYLAKNVLWGLSVAIALVGILFAIVLGSVRLGLLSLIPNLLPLIVIAGVMGFYGIDLKISTSIIFILSFGIAVDDSIHFLSRFQREMQARSSVTLALRHTIVSTGKAIALTTIILLCGFLTLTFSNFLGTFYLGGLVAVTLFLAAFFDLTLLPVLLFLFYDRKKNIDKELAKVDD